MVNYRERIGVVLNRVVNKNDLKNGQTKGFQHIDDRTHKNAYESAWRIPLGYSYIQVRQMIPALCAACGGPVEIENRGGVVIIRAITEDFPKVIHFNREHLKTDALLIGYNRLGEPIYHRLLSHILAAGAAGAGKTDFLRFVIYQLVLMGFEVCIVDMKGFSFMPFDTIPNIKVARNLNESYKMLAETFGELERREQLVIEKRNRDVIKSFKPIVLIIDEAAQIAPEQNSGEARDAAKLCDEYCAKIAQKGREPKVQLIYCTQRPDAKVINPQVKANVEAAIAFRTKTRTNSEIILDRSGAEEISPDTPGRCIYSGVKDIMVHVPYIGDDDAWNALLMPLKTEVIYEGRSKIRSTENASRITVDSDTTRSILIPAKSVAIKACIGSAQVIGGRKTGGESAARGHDEGMAVNPKGAERNGDSAEVDPADFT